MEFNSLVKTFLLSVRRKLHSFLFSPYILEPALSDCPFRFYVGSFEGSLWYGKHRYLSRWRESFSPFAHELQWIEKIIQREDIVADIGAHLGFFALFFSQWVGNKGKVFSFECNPKNYSFLKKNIELNHCSNVHLEHCAVGEKEGAVDVPADSSGLFCKTKFPKDIPVQMISLDYYFLSKNVVPTVIKVDVEGYELEVLKGSQTILKNKPKLFIELHNFLFAEPMSRLEEIFELVKHYKHCFIQESACDQEQPIALTRSQLAHISSLPNPHLTLF
ncbi:MAG: hypothetical protein S4CHLAM2_15130 [Chlamydiales bacterium]|nr:hypothetical protein [Chlamydiales bacterium]